MKQTIFILMFMWAGIVYAQIGGVPTNFNYGTKYPNATHEGDTLTAATKIPLFDATNKLNYYANLGDLGALAGVPRDSLIVQSPSSFGNIYNYWEGTEAQMDALLLSDPNFFDDILWICTDCPQQGSGGTANQFVMGDGSFKNFIDDDTFASATSTNIPSAESVKAYVDANSGVTVESGTFVPTLTTSSGTYTFTIEEANYRKIGDLVYISIVLTDINSSGSPTSPLTFGGLPFCSYSCSVDKEQILSCEITGSSVSYYSAVFRMGNKTASNIRIQTALDGSMSNLASVNFTSGEIRISGTYITND